MNGCASRVMSNVAMIVIFSAIVLVVWWGLAKVIYGPMHIYDARVEGPTSVHEGDAVNVSFKFSRPYNCRIEATRLLVRDGDNQEFTVQHSVYAIIGGEGNKDQNSSYTFEVPIGVVPKGKDSVKVHGFSRLQYFCNGLDYMIPNIMATAGYDLTVNLAHKRM